MSLMERAASAEKSQDLFSARVGINALEVLRERVAEVVPYNKVAQLIRSNPRKARNEMRLACERVIKDEPWLVKEPLTTEGVIDRFLDEVFGLGPLEGMLYDESITEIMINGSKSLYFEQGGLLYRSSRVFGDDDQVYALIDRIIGPLGRRVDESSPMVNARLVQGHRVNAIIPPLAIDGPVVTIRKFRTQAFSLEEMKGLGSFDAKIEQLLRWAVLRRCNIAVSGGTGSGKTTLLNALSAVIPFGERVITIEDSAELRFDEHPHVIRLEARPKNAEGTGEVTIRDLVVNSLRMRPDRIVVGECRGAEALDMLQAMSTGHDGSLTTLHANSPQEAISRLSTMIRYGAELPVEVIEMQIATAIDLVVQTTRYPDGSRGVCEVSQYTWNSKTLHCEVDRFFVNDLVTGDRRWCSFPGWLDDLPYLGIASKEEVERWKRS
ncbi:MAG: CpaF family protein [Eggerthellaceae bacterium]